VIPTYAMLAPRYVELWNRLVPSPEHMAELTRICTDIKAHQTTYEAVSTAVWGAPDYWWYVGITDQMEAGGGADRYLGNGQPLDRVTTEVPAGRGPFPDFVAGAVDALRGIKAPTSVSQAAYNWEGFNGWGYLTKPIEDPYLASFSNCYTKGKYVADHVYDPEAVSGQAGALTILKVLMPAYSPHGPAPPTPQEQHPAAEPTAPIIDVTGGHVMLDITTIEKDVDIGLALAEKIVPYLSFFGIPAPIVSLLQSALAGARTIESSLGLPTNAAVVSATSHNTPGAPNAAPLNG